MNTKVFSTDKRLTGISACLKLDTRMVQCGEFFKNRFITKIFLPANCKFLSPSIKKSNRLSKQPIPSSECRSALPVPASVAQTNGSHKVTCLGYRADVSQ